MTKKEKERWLKAVDELIQHYYRRKYSKECPLCKVVGWYTASDGGIYLKCKDCLWFIFEKRSCSGEHRIAAFNKDCYPTFEQWRKDSLKRLNKWKKKLKGAEDGDKSKP